jgi:methionyl-tRNA formyltransferase
MKIGYFADGPWSHEALDRIINDSNLSVAFICARFDKPDSLLHSMAKQQGIPFFINENINSESFLNIINIFECDLFVSMSFNQIFRRKIASLPLKGAINCHAGKLPYYKGRNVLNWVLINDEKEFGVTVHYIDDGIDTGDIILQQNYPISDLDDYSTLLNRSYKYCADILLQSLKLIQSNGVLVKNQKDIHPVGFYCPQRRPGDEYLDWNKSSRDVFNFVRAISRPGPEARTLNGDKEIKINKIELIIGAPAHKSIPGAVLNKGLNSFVVKTGDSFVKVVEWDSSVKIKVGDRLK